MAGLVDFAFNVGASLAGVIVGTVVDAYSWSSVFSIFAFGAIATSCLFVLFAVWMNRLGMQIGASART